MRLYRVLLSVVFLGVLTSNLVRAADFLDVDQAFSLSVNLKSDVVELGWSIAPGYKLYKDKITLQVVAGDKNLQNLVKPNGQSFYDENFHQVLEIYKKNVVVKAFRQNGSKLASDFYITYQGCADEGLCYPPVTKRYSINENHALLVNKNTIAINNQPGAEKAIANDVSSKVAFGDLGIAQEILLSKNIFKVCVGFLLFGLLLSFTPCVLPMVPILSSIIVGHSSDQKNTKLHGFLMALAYCAGMAIIYTSMGILAGLMGEGLSGYLQKPIVLIIFAFVLVLFSLSMFDVVQIQLPSGAQNRLSSYISKIKGGHFIGVFVMGAISSLIVGPCVAGPLAGALIYISQTRDVFLGGVALFSMAIGMSVPLLLTGVSAASLLPRAGQWMVKIKNIFGLLLLAVAIWMLMPLLASHWFMFILGLYFIFCAVCLGLLDPIPVPFTFANKLSKVFAVSFFLFGVFEFFGAASGASDPIRPIEWVGVGANANIKNERTDFERVQSVQEINKILKSSSQPIVLDFYADWCISCKQMEKQTFANSDVQVALQKYKKIQIDITDNKEEHRLLLKKYGLFGPPALVVFDAKGVELVDKKIIGYINASNFLDHLSTIVIE